MSTSASLIQNFGNEGVCIARKEWGIFAIMDKQLSLFKKWLQDNKLVHVEIVQRKIGRKGFFGRFVSIEEDKKLIVFYDVDQKQVLSFQLNMQSLLAFPDSHLEKAFHSCFGSYNHLSGLLK